MMELYATGEHTISTLQKMLKRDFGKSMSRENINRILRNRFYVGEFQWGGETYCGKHELFVSMRLFEQIQAVLDGHNRPKYSKRDIAFRGLLNCGYDGCMVTGELKKEKYVYYRCTGHRGKCDLPRFREEELAARLGEPLKGLQVPAEIVTQIVETLRRDQGESTRKLHTERSRLDAQLSTIRTRMDAVYEDKIDGKISEDFWQRKTDEWRTEEQQIKMALSGLNEAEAGDRALDAAQILELAQNAYFLYVAQNPVEQAKLLRKLFLNCSIDATNITPTSRYPFDRIFERGKS